MSSDVTRSATSTITDARREWKQRFGRDDLHGGGDELLSDEPVVEFDVAYLARLKDVLDQS
jgi:hypothetical protein